MLNRKMIKTLNKQGLTKELQRAGGSVIRIWRLPHHQRTEVNTTPKPTRKAEIVRPSLSQTCSRGKSPTLLVDVHTSILVWVYFSSGFSSRGAHGLSCGQQGSSSGRVYTWTRGPGGIFPNSPSRAPMHESVHRRKNKPWCVHVGADADVH